MRRGGVELTPAPLAPDRFEVNDSFETATRFMLRETAGFAGIELEKLNGAGIYDLTLHKPDDRDFFSIRADVANPLAAPVVRIVLSDLPLDVTVFDAGRSVVQRQLGVRQVKLTLPRDQARFIQVASARPTRYRLRLSVEVDPAHLPGAATEQVVVPLPDLGDPPFRVDHEIQHVLVQIGAQESQTRRIALAAVEGQALNVQLLALSGTVLRQGTRRQGVINGSVEVDLAGLKPGSYTLRIAHADAQATLAATPLNVQRLPVFG